MKRNERIKKTFIVDECKGSLRGRGQVNKGRSFRWAGLGVQRQQCRERPRVTVHVTLNTVHNAAILPK